MGMTQMTYPQAKSHTADGVTVSFIPRSQGFLVQVRTAEAITGEYFDFQDQAEHAYRALVAQHTPAELADGGTVTSTVERTAVTVQAVRPGVYSVATELGTYRVEAFCRSYPTLDEAYAAQAHAIGAFARHGTDTAIEAARAELEAENRDLLPKRGHTAQARREAVSRHLDAIATLADLARTAELVADVTAFLNRAA
jgi:hypothetical protein